MSTEQELAHLQSELSKRAAQDPSSMLMSMMFVLIDEECGTNEALRTYHRVRIFRRILAEMDRRDRDRIPPGSVL